MEEGLGCGRMDYDEVDSIGFWRRASSWICCGV
jgi:hypothetical protein